MSEGACLDRHDDRREAFSTGVGRQHAQTDIARQQTDSRLPSWSEVIGNTSHQMGAQIKDETEQSERWVKEGKVAID
jgi:hypothetical protein